MQTVVIGDAREFSLDKIVKRPLLETEDMVVTLLCFEAGQRDEEVGYDGSVIYQVLEGEALIREGSSSSRLGKGRLLAVPKGAAHTLENAGGGLLVMLATRPA